MFKRVLVPLDGSMLAESALDPALHLAQRANGTVYLMRVPIYIDSGAQISPEYQRAWTADADMPEHEDVTAYLSKTQDKLLRPGVLVKIIVGEGERSEAILDIAVTKNIDLILMASHARSGISRWLLGSVSGQVIRKSQVPVMIVRRPTNFNHILITLDGSDLAERVIEPALAFASGFGSRVTFLHVKESNALTNDDGEIEDNAQYLEKVTSKFVNMDQDAETAVIKGSAAEKILSFAAQNQVDLIAMSTHGRSGLRKLFFGSVTEKVMCDSGCAMLITHPPE
jgi:nucleotide-binding universal stress UspA family protein